MALTLREKLYKYPRAFLRSVFIIVNNLYAIPTYVIWMVMLLPLKRYHPDGYYKIEGLFFHWLLAVVSCWSWSAGYDVVELGDDITQCINQKTLVMSNHQSTSDVPLMMAALNAKKNVLPNVMWIMDRLFKYTNFGIVSKIHQDFFITSGKDHRDQSIVLLKKHLHESFIPRQRNWMVIFPEGGFLRKRREVSQRFAKKNDLPVLHHVTLPRVGAMKAIFDVLLPNNSSANNNLSKSVNGNFQPIEEIQDPSSIKDLKYILDVTIAYSEAKPLDLWNILHGLRDPCQTFFFYRLYNSIELPKDSESLTQWIYDRFAEKEEILEGFYKTGSFLFTSANTPTVVQQDMLRYVIIHLFFITSTYVHLQMLSTLVSYYNTYIYSVLK